MTPDHEARLDQLSHAFRMAHELDGQFTAEQIHDMPMSEFAKLRASVLGDEADPMPTRPVVAPVADEAQHGTYAEDMPPDFRNMGMSEYRAVRNQFIRPGNARGLFDQ